MKKNIKFIWLICCELLSVGCASFSKIFPMTLLFILGIAPPVVSYLKERQRTKQIKIIENANIERKKIKSQTKIREMEIIKEIIIRIDAIPPISIFEICQYISRYIFVIYINTYIGY